MHRFNPSTNRYKRLEKAYHFSTEEYSDYMHAADIGIQFRTYQLGGLSGALIDCISTGLTTVANDHLKNNLNSPDYVHGVDDSLIISDITSKLDYLIGNAIYKENNLDLLKKYLDEYNFSKYVEKLLETLAL